MDARKLRGLPAIYILFTTATFTLGYRWKKEDSAGAAKQEARRQNIELLHYRM